MLCETHCFQCIGISTYSNKNHSFFCKCNRVHKLPVLEGVLFHDVLRHFQARVLRQLMHARPSSIVVGQYSSYLQENIKSGVNDGTADSVPTYAAAVLRVYYIYIYMYVWMLCIYVYMCVYVCIVAS